MKATVRPEYRPEEPNPDDKRELPDENAWVFDEYSHLRDVIATVIEPLDQYIATYSRFENEYKFDPDAMMEPYEDPENWPEVEELKSRVLFHREEEKRIEKEIPEEIICSIFQISTKVIRDMLSVKHRKISNEMIELIAKIGKQTARTILDDFEGFNNRVEG